MTPSSSRMTRRNVVLALLSVPLAGLVGCGAEGGTSTNAQAGEKRNARMEALQKKSDEARSRKKKGPSRRKTSE